MLKNFRKLIGGGGSADRSSSASASQGSTSPNNAYSTATLSKREQKGTLSLCTHSSSRFPLKST